MRTDDQEPRKATIDWDAGARHLAKLLEESGLSHNQAATISGVPQPTISRFISRENRAMDLDTIWALAQAIGVTLSQLLGETPLEPDAKIRAVTRLMQKLPEYRKTDLLKIGETLAEQPDQLNSDAA